MRRDTIIEKLLAFKDNVRMLGQRHRHFAANPTTATMSKTLRAVVLFSKGLTFFNDVGLPATAGF